MTICRENILNHLTMHCVRSTRTAALNDDAKADKISAEILNVMAEEQFRPMLRASLRGDAIGLKVLFDCYVHRALLRIAEASAKESLDDEVESEEREHEERMAARIY